MLLPKGSRASGNCPMPVLGPKVASSPTGSAPRTTPITMATKPGQNPNPSVKANVPVKTPESSILGANHTVKFRHDEP